MTDASGVDAERWAFEAFALAHPIETYAMSPERFWAFFQRERPGVSRADMEAVMRETAARATASNP